MFHRNVSFCCFPSDTGIVCGTYIRKLSQGPGKRGHIVAHDVSWAAQTGKHLLRTQNVSEQNQKHFCVRNKCCARGQTGKHLCRRLPAPLLHIHCVRFSRRGVGDILPGTSGSFKALANEDTLLRTHCCP